MKEELIRVENGCFQREDCEYHFELSISRGECIGISNLLTSSCVLIPG